MKIAFLNVFFCNGVIATFKYRERSNWKRRRAGKATSERTLYRVYLHQSWLQQVVLVSPNFSQALILYRNIKINRLGNKRCWAEEKGYKTFQLVVSKRDSWLLVQCLSSVYKFIPFEGWAEGEGDPGDKTFCTLTKKIRQKRGQIIHFSGIIHPICEVLGGFTYRVRAARLREAVGKLGHVGSIFQASVGISLHIGGFAGTLSPL